MPGTDPAIHLRPLRAEEVAVVAAWPPYPAEFAALDYALRGNGWLAEFGERPGIWRYGAELAGDLIAFALLASTAPGEAEFRLALRADQAGRGYGRSITDRVLSIGFAELGLARIHLIVRQNNSRAGGLYRRLGFVLRGECRQVVDQHPAAFFRMDLRREDYLAPLARLPAAR